jgi:uncharacterized protein (DUF736 family)
MATDKVWEQKEGTWSLRKNPNKKNDKAPDFIGTIAIAGVTYDLSAWDKIAASGAHWLSGTVKLPFVSQGAPKQYAPPEDDSSIPF